MSEPPDEEKEKATVLSHIASVLYPAFHLSPWASRHKKRMIVAIVSLKAIGAISKELDKRIWLDLHPEATYYPEDSTAVKVARMLEWLRAVPAASASAEKVKEVISQISELTSNVTEEDLEEALPGYDSSSFARGANGMFGYCMDTVANLFHDYAVSEGGLGRSQGIGWGGAMRSGISIEPKPRSWSDKILGKNKSQDQIASGPT